jgi:hypothetical protein
MEDRGKTIRFVLDRISPVEEILIAVIISLVHDMIIASLLNWKTDRNRNT